MHVNKYGELEGPCPIIDLGWAEKIHMKQTETKMFCGSGCSLICSDEFLRRFRKRCSAAGIGNIQMDLF